MPDLAALTVEHFTPLVGETFRLTSGDGAAAVDVTLREARAGTAADGSGVRAPFSLVFGGPPQPILPQGIHRLEHPSLGALDLFLVPIAGDAGGTRYQAVFA